MRARLKILSLLFAVMLVVLALTGCWDSRELNNWFILTGTGIDVIEDPEQMQFTFQVANIKQGQSGSGSGGDSGGSDDSVVTFDIISKSLDRSISMLNRDNDNKLLFQHNQIRLFGIEAAQCGIKEHLDLLLRDYQARLEVPMAVVDGRAEDILKLKLPHEPNSGIFLGGYFKDLGNSSEKYIVRLIDFVHVLLDGSAAPVMPLLKINKSENDESGITFEGMAVFKDDKMIGRLNNDETLGFMMSCGSVKRLNLEVEEGENKAVLHIVRLQCKRDLTVNDDNSVLAKLDIKTVINLSEVDGFKDKKPPELIKHLEKLAQEKIKELITLSFSKAKELKADVFGYSTLINQKEHKKWEKMKENWEEIFVNTEMTIKVDAMLRETGQISASLEMEEKNK